MLLFNETVRAFTEYGYVVDRLGETAAPMKYGHPGRLEYCVRALTIASGLYERCIKSAMRFSYGALSLIELRNKPAVACEALPSRYSFNRPEPKCVAPGNVDRI
jgi:hypothetical protein